MAHLLSRITGSGEEPPTQAEVVAEGCLLNARIAGLMEQLAEIRPFEVICPTRTPATAYNNTAHNYESPQAARHWNILRLMKLFVNKWIYRAENNIQAMTCDASFTSTRSRILEYAAINAETMATEILGSVAYFQRQPCWRNPSLTSARWLIWPLSAVAVSTLAPVSARIYAHNVLQDISRDNGIAYATEAKGMVDQERGLEDWLHLCHLS